MPNGVMAPGIGLALSGGGFRASLFHLGVLKRLDELGILDRVTHISAVSGGAVTAALYVFLRRRDGAQFAFAEIERALLRGVKANPRTRWLLVTLFRRIVLWLLPLWARVPLERWLRVITFDSFFRTYFFRDRMLDYVDADNPQNRPPQTPRWPRLILNTTSLEIGQDFYFTPTYVGPRAEAAMDPVAGPSRTAAHNVSIAQAVGASACFPLVFPPFTLRVNPNPDRQDDNTPRTGVEIRQTQLVDGGIYDNQGFRVFLTDDLSVTERVAYLIASDASKTTAPSESPLPAWINPLKRLGLLYRAHSITEDRARWERYTLLRYKLQAHHLRQAAFFHTDTETHEAAPHRLPDEMARHLVRLRTDFDSFSDLEICALMYHGYTLVNHRVSNYCPDLLPAAVPALRRWPEFVTQVQALLPPRGRIQRHLLNWLERPWRPAFAEADPTNPGNPAAWQAATRHIERGATGSLVWRALQRLGDRGAFWQVVAFLGKTLVVLFLLYLLRELLIVVVTFFHWLISQTVKVFGYAGWLSQLLEFVAAALAAAARLIGRLVRWPWAFLSVGG